MYEINLPFNQLNVTKLLSKSQCDPGVNYFEPITVVDVVVYIALNQIHINQSL